MNAFIYWSLKVSNRLVGDLNNMAKEMTTDQLQLKLVVRVRGTCATSHCLSSTVVLSRRIYRLKSGTFRDEAL